MKTALAAIAMALLMVSATGCSDSPCEAAAEAYCDRACDCTPGDECTVIEGGSSSTSDDRASCLFFNKSFVCDNDDSTTDDQWAACEEAVAAGMCVVDNGREGMQQVPECSGLLF